MGFDTVNGPVVYGCVSVDQRGAIDVSLNARGESFNEPGDCVNRSFSESRIVDQLFEVRYILIDFIAFHFDRFQG